MANPEYCPHCLQLVSVYPMAGPDGKTVTPCPNCGALFNPGWYRYVSHKEAIQIIESRKPLGLFVEETGIEFIGIDNQDGNAWTEEFPDLIECLSWLAGE